MTPSALLSPLLSYCTDLPGFSPDAIEVAETEQRIGTMLSTLHHWERSAVEWRERAEGLHARVAELEARIAELQPMAECAAIMAVAGYFSRMRGPDFYAYQFPTCVRFSADTYNGSRPLHAIPLYAGSAPVPAAQAFEPDTLARATVYARDIVTWLHRDHYADNTAFEPFGDLLGLLSQIDNMICGWKEHPAAQAEAKVADGWVLVPREPTEEMVIAALKEVDPLRELIEWTDGHGFMREDVRRAWSAMLAAKAKGE